MTKTLSSTTVILAKHSLLGLKQIFAAGWRKIIFPGVLLLGLLSVPLAATANSQQQGQQLLEDAQQAAANVSDAVMGEINQFLESTGLNAAAAQIRDRGENTLSILVDDIGNGRVPVIGNLTEPFQDNMEQAMENALAQAQIATDILSNIVGDAAVAAAQTILSSPLFENADFIIITPTGYTKIYRQGLEVSICTTTVFSGVVVISGISNGVQLCNNPDKRLANPNPNQPLQSFSYIAAGHTHLLSSIILLPTIDSMVALTSSDNIVKAMVDVMPKLKGDTYLNIHDQWIKISLAGADLESLVVEASVAIGVKLGINYIAKADTKYFYGLKMKIKPTHAVTVIQGMISAMNERATDLNVDINEGLEGTEAEAMDVARIIKTGYDYLDSYEQEYGSIGDVGLYTEIRINGGLGFLDSGISFVTIRNITELSVPLSTVTNITVEELAFFLDIAFDMVIAADKVAEPVLKIIFMTGGPLYLAAYPIVFGELPPNPQELLEMITDLPTDVAALMEAKISTAIRLSSLESVDIIARLALGFAEEVKLKNTFTIDLLGEKKKDNITIFKAGITTPIGKLVGNLDENEAAIANAYQALVNLTLVAFEQGAEIDEQVWSDLSAGILPETKYTLLISPALALAPALAPVTGGAVILLSPVIVGVKDVYLVDTLNLLVQPLSSMRDILFAIHQSATEPEPSLQPLRTAIEQEINKNVSVLADVIKESELVLSAKLGANGSIAKIVGVKIGAKVKLDMKAKTKLLYLLLDSSLYEAEDKEVLISATIPVSITMKGAGYAGIDGVELLAEGGISTTANVLSLKAKHWDGDLPAPANMQVAGFTVLEFEGTVNQDGSFAGSGLLMLPMGGVVSANFEVDANGDVSGRWSGGFNMGSLGNFDVLTGTLDNEGLHAVIPTLGAELNLNVSLTSKGVLTGSYSDSLRLAGFASADVDLTLMSDGTLSGSASMSLLGSTLVSENLVINPLTRQVEGTFTGTLTIGGPDGHTISEVSLDVSNGGFIGTASMNIPGLGGTDVALQYASNGDVIATFNAAAGSELGDITSGQISLRITADNVVFMASLDLEGLDIAGNEVNDFFVNNTPSLTNIIPLGDAVTFWEDEIIRLDGVDGVGGEIREERARVRAEAERQLGLAEDALKAITGPLGALLDVGVDAALIVAKNLLELGQNGGPYGIPPRADEDTIRARQEVVDLLESLPDAQQAFGDATATVTSYAEDALGNLPDSAINLSPTVAALILELEFVAKPGLAGAELLLGAAQAGDTAISTGMQNLYNAFTVASDAFSVLSISVEINLNDLPVTFASAQKVGINTRNLVMQSQNLITIPIYQLPKPTLSVTARLRFLGDVGVIDMTLNLANPVDSFYQILQSLLAKAAHPKQLGLVLNTADITKPSVTATSPSGWQAANTLVLITAIDPSPLITIGGKLVKANKTGIASMTINQAMDDFPVTPPITVPGNRAMVLISNEGETTLKIFVRDRKGNQSSTTHIIKIDKTAPQITVLTPTDANIIPYDVDIAVADTGSGVAYFTVSATGAETIARRETGAINFTQEAIGGSGTGAISYVSSDPDVATVNASTGEVTIVAAGTTFISATKAGDSQFKEASDSYLLTINGINQAGFDAGADKITTFVAPSPTDLANSFTQSATGGSGSGAVSYASSNNMVATVNAQGFVTIHSAGTATITATKTGDAFFNPASDSYLLTVNKANQTALNAGADRSRASNAANFTQSASGGSGTGTISYVSSDPDVATVNASTGEVDILTVGTASIVASKAADTNYFTSRDAYLLTVTPPTGALALSFAGIKTFKFSWTDEANKYYKLMENPDGASGFVQVGDDIPSGVGSVNHIVPLYARMNAQYILQTCKGKECRDSNTVSIVDNLVSSIGYFKASNTGARDGFGGYVSLSADGSTLAVGSMFEDSNTTGINNDQPTDKTSEFDSGAVYIFTSSDGIWSQQAYIKGHNTGASDWFGSALSLSVDGNTLAVGAIKESSSARGINDDQTDNGAPGSGAVYVFNRIRGNWTQQAYIKASNAETGDVFGSSVSLSADGNTLAVGAVQESSEAIGIDSEQKSNGASGSGAVYIFTRSGGISSALFWSQQAYVKGSNTDENDNFGFTVSLSADGNTLAVGAVQESSDATGINNDQSNNKAIQSGAVYVFTSVKGLWSQQAYIKASNTDVKDWFGINLSLSADGNTLAVGSMLEDSDVTGINNDQFREKRSDFNAGAVYIFTSNRDTWSQQAYIKGSNTGANDGFGSTVSLSADGNTLAVAARYESSIAKGINNDEINDEALRSGAVYIFTSSGGIWSQQAYVKASNTEQADWFGMSVSLSADGTLAVGAMNEGSKATGIGGDQTDDSASGSGAVYLY